MIQVRVVVTGPGSCINQEYEIIKRALKEHNIVVIEHNDYPHKDPFENGQTMDTVLAERRANMVFKTGEKPVPVTVHLMADHFICLGEADMNEERFKKAFLDIVHKYDPECFEKMIIDREDYSPDMWNIFRDMYQAGFDDGVAQANFEG